MIQLAQEGRTRVTLKDTQGSVQQDNGSASGVTKVHLGSLKSIWDHIFGFKKHILESFPSCSILSGSELLQQYENTDRNH